MSQPDRQPAKRLRPGPLRLRPLVDSLSSHWRHRQLSLRVRLLVGALLLATVPLFVASIILPRKVQTTLTELGQAQLVQVADDLAAITQNEVELHVATARSLAATELLRSVVLRADGGHFDSAQESPAITRHLQAWLHGADREYQNIFLADSHGTVLVGVVKDQAARPTPGLHIRDRAYFEAVRTTRQPVVSDPVVSKLSGVPVVVVAVPILDDAGRFAGLAGISIEVQHLSALISGKKIGHTGYPFAIDRTGILVAHPDPARFYTDALIRLADADRLVGRMRAGERGIEPYISSKGQRKIAAFAPVRICGWSVGASIEISEFQAPAQRIRSIIFAMIGACVVIAIVVAATFAVGLEQLKLALTEARASEARFKLLARVASGAIWDWNLATDELWWNEGLLTTFGCQPVDVANYTALRLRIPPSERDAVSIGLRTCLNDGTWSGEHHFLRHDGTAAYILHRAYVVRDPEGRAVRVLGSMTDISARRATEQKIAEQAALLNQTRDGIIVKDLDQIIQFWNSGAEKLYGWTAAEAIGRRADEILRVDSDLFAEASRAVIHDGHWAGRLQKTTKTGLVLTLESRWTLLRDDDDRPKSILALDTDITERLQMEARFLRAQRLESIGTLAGGIAHDLNNLLSPILIGVGLLKQSPLSADDTKVISYIEQSALRGTNLVKQVLSFARGVEGARVSVHIGYVIREVEAMTRSTFPKNIVHHIDIPKQIRLVRADPTQLNQVLLNLCVNARDAMPAGGTLTLSARNIDLDQQFVQLHPELKPGPHLLVEVADTGTGMAPETIEKIFEPFFTTKAPGKGTGLGLSTVIGIIRSHGGTISAYSELGRGSTFKVYLPTTDELAPDATAPSAPPPSGHGELILLVDDEPAILNLGKRALESFGYKVLLATDGAHAFALYHRHRAEIDLVLTDMMMPLMDGLALIAALRRVDPAIVVIGASGLNDHNNQLKAADAGIKHFLCKPYTAAALLGLVATALAERQQRSQPPPA